MDWERFQGPYEGTFKYRGLYICITKILTRDHQVYLPAIAGYAPSKMVQCLAALLDLCYFARRAWHTTDTLQEMRSALDRFHELRPVFEEVGVCPDGFSLPRQHGGTPPLYQVHPALRLPKWSLLIDH